MIETNTGEDEKGNFNQCESVLKNVIWTLRTARPYVHGSHITPNFSRRIIVCCRLIIVAEAAFSGGRRNPQCPKGPDLRPKGKTTHPTLLSVGVKFSTYVRNLGRLAGNTDYLGTPDRHTFPPDGKPRTPRLARARHTVAVASSSRLCRSRARSPVSSSEHFAWMGTLFGRKDTQTMNQLHFWMKCRWWIGGGRAVNRAYAKWRWPMVNRTSGSWRDLRLKLVSVFFFSFFAQFVLGPSFWFFRASAAIPVCGGGEGSRALALMKTC